jgi:CRP-like cAMP-binding protein
MINRPESKNDFTISDAGQRYRSADMVAARAHLVAEATSGTSRAHKFIRPIPFNGLLTNKLLTALPGENFARLLQYLEPVSLGCGEDLYGFGEGIRDVYFPETAVISHLHVLEDGSTTEAALIGKEGVTGLSAIFAAPAPSHWTQVIIPGTALRMDAEDLRQEFARGGAMQRLLLAYASTRLAQLSQRAVCNGRHMVGERLCSWLLMIHDRVGDEQLPLTHEQIARHLGARRAGITIAANILRDRQIIGYSRGQIRIIDRHGLEMAACECYRTLSRQNFMPAQL